MAAELLKIRFVGGPAHNQFFLLPRWPGLISIAWTGVPQYQLEEMVSPGGTKFWEYHHVDYQQSRRLTWWNLIEGSYDRSRYSAMDPARG